VLFYLVHAEQKKHLTGQLSFLVPIMKTHPKQKRKQKRNQNGG